MARPERYRAESEFVPLPVATGGYRPGGEVGQMQADLAHRLGSQRAIGVAIRADAPGERMMRFMSVAGGYLALGAAYAGMISLMP